MKKPIRKIKRYARGGYVDEGSEEDPGPIKPTLGKSISGGISSGAGMVIGMNNLSKTPVGNTGGGPGGSGTPGPPWTDPNNPPGLYRRGGPIKRVAGKPIGKEDGLIAAQKGEYVIRKAAAKKLGTGVLNTINKGKLPKTKGR
jgi:hypothetical protein